MFEVLCDAPMAKTTGAVYTITPVSYTHLFLQNIVDIFQDRHFPIPVRLSGLKKALIVMSNSLLVVGLDQCLSLIHI